MIKEFQGTYRWLSNFAPVTIRYNEREFVSVEHAYVSAKSDELFFHEGKEIPWPEVCADKHLTPGAIKQLGRRIKLKPNWDQIKLQVMESCLREKYKQEPYKSKLLATGTQLIQEGNKWKDRYWGIDLETLDGENHLGKLIMKIRKELQNEEMIKKTN